MSEPKRFQVIKEHLTLLRHARTWWDGTEFGAPGINPKRPYGNSDVVNDLADILGIEGFVDHEGDRRLSSEEFERLGQLHVETETALEIALRTGEFKVGLYETSGPYSSDWRPV